MHRAFGSDVLIKGEKEMNRKYRKTVIAGNWKMNKTPSQTKEFMTQLKAIMPKGRWCDVAQIGRAHV